MSKGPNHRRKNMIGHLIERGGVAAEKLVTLITEKIKRRGEWKHKTKRSLSSAAARSKSKKGKK